MSDIEIAPADADLPHQEAPPTVVQPVRRPGLRELGQPWTGVIVALSVALLLAVAGLSFLAGRLSVDPLPAANHVTPDVVIVQVPFDQGSKGSATAAPAVAPTPDAGRQVGTYRVDLHDRQSVALGDAQFDPTTGSNTGDVYYDFSTSTLRPVNASSSFVLLGTAVPTFQACAAGVKTGPSARTDDETSFCLSKPGRLIGLVVDGGSSVSGKVVLLVTVWLR